VGKLLARWLWYGWRVSCHTETPYVKQSRDVGVWLLGGWLYSDLAW